jgi:hypothetical protein
MTVFLVSTALVVFVWLLLRQRSASKKPAEFTQVRNQYATEAQIRAFFADTANFVNVPVEEIFAVLGRPLEYDDWDWGRLSYEWNRPSLRMRMVTRGGGVLCVEELDPRDTSRFGTTLVTIWGDASL